ncbi:MAG: CpsD/CapB family tyrosine-protein kinase [Actinobacteria bacterium]|nr:CpsD/CapB family tyrosine-protein kinase [Actinomycetota bacterium]
MEARIRELQASTDRRSPQYARTLIDKAEQLRTFEALEGSNAFLLRAATGAVKIQPRPLRSAALGLILGAFLGLGLALLWEVLDTRVRSAEEIGDRLKLPLLARVPEPPRQLARQNRLVMVADPRSSQAEAFRMLRTNLEFVNLEREARTIMITSAVEREGKSTTIANLAVALAKGGRRVVLVDLDLRRPFLDVFFGLQGRPGLTDVALGRVSLEDAIAPISIAEGGRGGARNGHVSTMDGVLEVLPSGPIPPDPGDFMGTRRLQDILALLGERADLVLIDAPPLLHVGDALALSAHVDALLVVTRLSVVRTPMLAEVQRLLDSCAASKLGFVETGTEQGAAYGYGSYYHPTERQPESELVA